MAESTLQQTLDRFQQELRKNEYMEVYNLLTPNLKNGILPMFRKDRWAKGYGQQTDRYYHRMEPALRLASLMLSEDCMLPWFHHLTFGHRRCDKSTYQPKVYIAVHKNEHDEKRKQETKRKLHKMSRFITLMFVPRKYNKRSYGVTWRHRRQVDWYHKFFSGELPDITLRYRARRYEHHGTPCITMNTDFQDFFADKQFYHKPKSYNLRVMFLFALTLLHECAHAYYYYLGRYHREPEFGRDEPYWSLHEKKAELGYSWETVTLGRIMNPHWGDIKECKILTSFQTVEYADRAELEKTLRNLSKFESLENEKGQLKWYNPDDTVAPGIRGKDWFSYNEESDNKHIICILQVIPMEWIAHWFREEEWETKRRIWREKKEYTPPSLGQAFTLVYHRDERGYACLYKPVSDKADADPYLDKVRGQAEKMGLYDDLCKGEDDSGYRSEEYEEFGWESEED